MKPPPESLVSANLSASLVLADCPTCQATVCGWEGQTAVPETVFRILSSRGSPNGTPSPLAFLLPSPAPRPSLSTAPDFAAAHTITFEVDVFDVYNGQAAAFATATILPTSVTVETLATTAGSITTTGDVVAGLGEYFDRRRSQVAVC